jgi:glutathione peroxidase
MKGISMFRMPVCLFAIVAAAMLSSSPGVAAMPLPASIYELPIEAMKPAASTDGATTASAATTTTLAPYKGQVLLLVNVASRCGFTKQYKGLEALHRKYADQGLRVLGFPCNDFGGQEPGTELEIVNFCKTNYDVTFPLFAKLHAKGENTSPLYKWLTGEGSPYPGDVRWNFEKFLISREWKLVARYRSATAPDSAGFLEAIEKQLAVK